MRVAEAPALVVLAAVGAGLVVASQGHWRIGSGVLGAALVLAAVLRVVLSPRDAGWLVVRSRAFDTGLLVVLGAAVLGLALVIPRP